MKSSITIKAGNKSYPVFIGESVFEQLPQIVTKYCKPNKILFIIDSNVFKYHFVKIKSAIQKLKVDAHIFKLNAAEKNKSLITAQKILSKLLNNKFGKDSLVISIGGGITGDLSGYVASVYMRGIDIIHVPTTLLSVVDSSIGGKTGINFSEVKNIIGTYHHPSAVIADLEFLKTLPKKEITNGLGEIIKYGFIAGEEFYKLINDNFQSILKLEKSILKKIVTECINIKCSIVIKDEKDSGLRKILNFGHTFAHAFESSLNHKVKHGEAVAAGIICAVLLSFKKGMLTPEDCEKLLSLPKLIQFSREFISLKSNKLIHFMKLDKKNREGNLKFVLIKNYGQLVMDVNANVKEIKFAVDSFKKEVRFKRGKTVGL